MIVYFVGTGHVELVPSKLITPKACWEYSHQGPSDYELARLLNVVEGYYHQHVRVAFGCFEGNTDGIAPHDHAD